MEPPDAGDAAVASDSQVDAAADPDARPADARVDAAIPPSCGDGTLDSGEVCDDGNNDSGDGCSANCQSDETCQNGIRDTAAGEVCDGADLGGLDCLDQGINAPMGTLACTATCTLDTSGCCPVWDTELVDDVDTNGSMTTSDVSVALDSLGGAHFAYRHDDLQELRYATEGSAGMVVDVVDTTGDTGFSPALALDSQNHPHILYRDGAGEVVLASRTSSGGAWTFDTVDTESSGGQRDLVIDSQDRPHAVYRVPAGARYAVRPSATWSYHFFEADAFRVSLAVDSGDHPHVAYLHWPTTDLDLRYAHDSGAGWSLTTVEQVGTSVMTMPTGDTSLAVDNLDHPHVAYQHVTDEDLKYAHHDGSAWQIQVVDSQGGVGHDVAIDLDLQQFPHIAYRDDSSETLRFVQLTAGGWVFQSPEDTAGSRLLPDLVLDPAGLAHIFYLKLSGTTVNHAFLEACP